VTVVTAPGRRPPVAARTRVVRVDPAAAAITSRADGVEPAVRSPATVTPIRRKGTR